MKLLAMFCLAFSVAASAQTSSSILPETPEPAVKSHRFLANKLNKTLVWAEFSTRALDAATTQVNLSNGCRCFKEDGSVFGLLSMKPVTGNAAVESSFFMGVAAGASALSSWMWNAGEYRRHGKAMRVVARLILLGDSGMEAWSGIHNLRLRKKR